jgi:perosamine synthetase
MRVPQFKSFVDKNDYARLEPVFENNYIAEGPFASQFSEKLLEIIGSKHGCFASNGTLALYLAMKALGIKAGDEVIVQNVTFIASANAVEMVGATPVFVDVKSFNDLSIDISQIELTSKTKAIMIAPLFGGPSNNVEEVREFCDQNNLFLIEDAAQALGISDGTNHCGTLGDVGTFSFYADKTITTAEGGYVVTDDDAVYERMLYLRNQGRIKSGTFIHPEIGYNFRITDLQAALGLSQLDKLDTIVSAKQHIYQRYSSALGDKVSYLKLRPDYSHIPFRTVIFVEDAEPTMGEMAADDIEPRSVFYPLHKQPCYSHLGYNDEDFPNSMECYQRGICLPTWVGLSDEQIDYVCESLLKAIS